RDVLLTAGPGHRRTLAFGDLHSEAAHTARCTIDQDLLARREPAFVPQPLQRSEPDGGRARRLMGRDARGSGADGVGLCHEILRERALSVLARVRQETIDRRTLLPLRGVALLDDAAEIVAQDERELAGVEKLSAVLARGHLSIGRIERRTAHPHQHLTRLWLRARQCGLSDVFDGAVLVDRPGFHAPLLVTGLLLVTDRLAGFKAPCANSV